ncbi:histidinol-phosphatase HisJ family protein [Alkalibacillus haloalkaliphilus]|uniref:histidinol-phosphatase HisJ family protein n=1 Tax=Alkalibacillus haloalkaliphilus TaxID=94136 RepID=UPI0029360D1C|nr:histidinol-phosphatase HisJ family protein [Alkalibacillus haloalkaliphilus]MDV2583415.1 histidinol-phosphatase HisJ family protein [Alkalibacillus haloalkaliphilus]
MFDNHMHSNFSADCEAPIENMIEAGIEKGVKELSFTEHIDYDYPDPSIVFDVDLQQYDQKIKEMQAAYKNKINIRKGIELGLQPHLTERYNQLLNEESFDFIIASMHTTDKKDLHSGNLFKGQSLNEAYEKYYTELYECVRDFDQFSILGHLDLVTRYKYEPGVYHFLDVIEEMFKIIIPRGQGIEINTSGYKYNMNRLLPSRNILQLYYDMGGEIITVGSDAHKPERVGDRIDEGYHLLKDIGFKYVSTFQNREPQFHKL